MVPTSEVERARLLALEVERGRFLSDLRGRRTPATWSLLGLMGCIFGLELALSPDLDLWMLHDLGGLEATRVWAGEWWRLASCAFIHGSAPHLLVNALALRALGGSVERVLGTQRFLVLFAASLVAGSLASLARLGDGISVGASGGIWGLLAAEALLVLHPRGPLPAFLKQRARRTALLNLGLNVAVSFMPHVDWAAHFGGALAGAGLTALLLQRERHWNVAPPRWWVGFAGLVVAGALGSLGMALSHSAGVRALASGEPWVPSASAALPLIERIDLPAVVALDVRRVAAEHGEPPLVIYGALRSSPLQVALSSGALPRPPTERDLAILAEQLSAPRDGDLGLPQSARAVWLGAEGIASEGRSLAGGLALDVAVRLGREAWVRVEVVSWKDMGPRWLNAAQHIAESVQWAHGTAASP